jgi:hypothetical protein
MEFPITRQRLDWIEMDGYSRWQIAENDPRQKRAREGNYDG